MAKQTFTTGQVLTAAQMTSLQQTAMGGGEATAKTASYTLVAADAGTTVIMNSASATTITVNTALFAAGDTVNIQNIGAGICTVTAGTATVNTAGSLALNQYEGGVLYFRSTSAATFFDYVQTGATSPLTTKGDVWGYSTVDARIPVGTNNQVLTADSTQALGVKWATPAGATTSYSLITSASNPTGTNTVTLSGLSGYNSLVFFYRGIIINATSGQIRVQFNSDTGSNYDYFYYTNFGSSNSGSNGTTTSFTSQYTSVANNEMNGYMQIQGANGTGKKLVMYPNFSYNYLQMHTGVWNNTAAISSINLTSVGGNFNGSSGTFQVYGSVV